MNAPSDRVPAPTTSAPQNVFERAFHASPAMQSIVRFPDGVLVEVNATFTKVLGFSREEVLGKTPFDLGFWVRPEMLHVYRAELEKNGRVRDFEVEVRAKDGTLRTVLLSSELVDINGVPHSMSAGIDITERKATEVRMRASERQLRESEARFSTAFRANPALVALTRVDDGKLVSVNDAFSHITGYSEAETLGKTTVELGIYPRPEVREVFLERIRTHGAVKDHEHLLRTKDGQFRTLLLSTESVDVDGAPHLLTVGVDITSRKLAEAEQERALLRERELSQLKTDFVSLVSHEFRTPLEIIMSSVDNLDRYHERLAPEQRQQLLRTINKSVRRMAGMMEDVLLLGRLDSGGTEFKPHAMDLGGFLQRVRDEMESATSRRCPIAIEMEEGLPSAHGDESVLRHVLTNLLSNAVKYSAPGQPVQLQLRRRDAEAEFRVIDRGCGIPLEDQKRLFQAFHRGSNVRQVPGTGLGLLIVRRCVELHGGGIDVASVEGQGTTFVVRFPLFASGA